MDDNKDQMNYLTVSNAFLASQKKVLVARRKKIKETLYFMHNKEKIIIQDLMRFNNIEATILLFH